MCGESLSNNLKLIPAEHEWWLERTRDGKTQRRKAEKTHTQSNIHTVEKAKHTLSGEKPNTHTMEKSQTCTQWRKAKHTHSAEKPNTHTLEKSQRHTRWRKAKDTHSGEKPNTQTAEKSQTHTQWRKAKMHTVEKS